MAYLSIWHRYPYEKITKLYMGTTKVKFHPFSMIVVPNDWNFMDKVAIPLPWSNMEIWKIQGMTRKHKITKFVTKS